jgi:carbamoyltransferase
VREAILGISAYYHDSAAALVVDGEVVAAAQEERFTRVKHDASFPSRAAACVLAEAGLSLADLSAVAFYDKPYLKFERLLETYSAFAPRGLGSFLEAIPVWIKEKLFMRRMLEGELGALGEFDARKLPLLFPEHHLSHAASAFFPSPFEEAAILTVDGVGEWATTTIGKGSGTEITVLRELHFPHSLGLLYSAFTAFCGFKVNSGEYKLMGLAPYGRAGSARVEEWKARILAELVDLREDGSLLLHMAHFPYATGMTMYDAAGWERLLGLPPRPPEGEDIGQEYMDLALAIQQITEEAVFRLARTARELTGCANLCMAGGVALNCVANGKLLGNGTFDDIWIQPAAGDAGGALGAALAAWHMNGGKRAPKRPDAMAGAYLGPHYGDDEVRRVARKYGAPCAHEPDFSKLASKVAALLAGGDVVGWHQGRMEFGPRALGNRSILGDPRRPEMQKKLNLKIKYREGFRPFAPSVLEERAGEYFDLDRPSPYMLLVAPVAEAVREPMPENYDDLPLYDRLYVRRSTIPAVTHVDFSARIQSVNRETNPRYWELIETFRREQGCGLLVNTSFNVRGEPIVNTPEDAYRCFMRTEMDHLVVGDFLFTKAEQPEWTENDDWRTEFVLD